MANTTTGVTRIIKAAGYSWKGLCAAWRYKQPFVRSAFWFCQH